MITPNIASHLPAMASQQPGHWAVIVQPKQRQSSPCMDEAWTYQQLDEESDRIAAGLETCGIGKGTRTVLMVKPGLDFFALVFALFKVEAILIAVDPGMGIKNLGKCLAEAEPEAFIGIGSAHVARLLLRWGKGTIRKNILVGNSPVLRPLMTNLDIIRRKGQEQAFKLGNTNADDTAAILFTSGSTGIPKGVVYTHANFTAQVEALKHLYQIQPGEVDLATFPLFALFAPALGMTSVIPHMDFTRPGDVNPEKIVDAVIDYQCTNMFGSPALLNRVGRHYQDMEVKLPSLRRVLSAGAPVSATILQRYKNLLHDDVEIFTPYGATESLPVSSIGSNEVLDDTVSDTDKGKGVCIGKPVDNIDVKIIRISDAPIGDWDQVEVLSANEIGEICVSGPQVTQSYYNRETQTQLAKIKTGNGFYHRMGDLGYMDEQGRLWFCGRKSHRVVTTNGTLFTDCCEGIFNTHPAVYRSALVGVTRDGETEPTICIELEANYLQEDLSLIKDQLIKLGSQHAITQNIKHVMFHPGFPVDIRHNAKINRERLAKWAQGQLA
ncbi:MAG: fatty acid CoA ligase family protein [Gammaproteobacteria bacterium]